MNKCDCDRRIEAAYDQGAREGASFEITRLRQLVESATARCKRFEAERDAALAKAEACQVCIDNYVHAAWPNGRPVMTDGCKQGLLDRIIELASQDAAPADDWDDKPLPEDEAIKAAHPCRSGSHDTYAEAMRLVGAKRSKAALVDLVNWLLVDLR